MPSTWATITVDGDPMETFVAAPQGDGPFPSVVVGMHAFGIDRFIQGQCEDLAAQGYIAVAPYLYHRQKDTPLLELIGMAFEDPKRREAGIGMKDNLRDDEIQRDILAAADYVDSLPQAGGSVGITGFCIGGRVTYLMAEVSDRFAAAAIFYGVDIDQAWGGDGPTPLSMTGQITCPLTGFFGDDDQNPPKEDVDRMEVAFTEAGVAHTFHRYPNTPHAFNDKFNPVRYTPEPAADAWSKLVAFFDSSLKK